MCFDGHRYLTNAILNKISAGAQRQYSIHCANQAAIGNGFGALQEHFVDLSEPAAPKKRKIQPIDPNILCQSVIVIP